METFFVFLDILGFQKVVEKNSTQELEDIIIKFRCGFNAAIDKSRTLEYVNCHDGLAGAAKIDISKLNFRLYSDSILIWTEDVKFNTFRNLLEAVSELLSYSMQNGMPLRGAMTYGDLLVSKENENGQFLSNEAIYGKALVEAYEEEGKMEWAGCVLTQKAWNKVKEIWSPTIASGSPDPNAYFNRFPLLTWYEIPQKNGTAIIKEYAIAINWNSAMLWGNKEIIDSQKIIDSFSAYGKRKCPNRKLEETLNFLEYTTKLQQRCFVSDVNESLKQRKSIPVPRD